MNNSAGRNRMDLVRKLLKTSALDYVNLRCLMGGGKMPTGFKTLLRGWITVLTTIF